MTARRLIPSVSIAELRSGVVRNAFGVRLFGNRDEVRAGAGEVFARPPCIVIARAAPKPSPSASKRSNSASTWLSLRCCVRLYLDRTIDESAWSRRGCPTQSTTPWTAQQARCCVRVACAGRGCPRAHPASRGHAHHIRSTFKVLRGGCSYRKRMPLSSSRMIEPEWSTSTSRKARRILSMPGTDDRRAMRRAMADSIGWLHCVLSWLGGRFNFNCLGAWVVSIIASFGALFDCPRPRADTLFEYRCSGQARAHMHNSFYTTLHHSMNGRHRPTRCWISV